MHPFFIVCCLLLFSLSTQAADLKDESEILATRGKGVVTQDAFSARADKIPADVRLGTLRDRNRLRDVINTLLLRSQLAADAREAGFDKEKIVQDRIELAIEAELADAWVQHYVETYPAADYLQLAREYYQLHQDEMMTPAEIDVSHILISTEEREAEEAFEIATSVYQQVQENPSVFDDLVLEYSEDPSAKSNKGKFKGVKKGDMVKAFEETAFALSEGEISGPVKTMYGFHIIRLDAYHASEPMAFEEVKGQLLDREHEKHKQRITGKYLNELSSLDVNMSQESLEELIDRLFGEEYVDPFIGEKDIE